MQAWCPPRLRGNEVVRESDRRERIALLIAVTVVVLSAPLAAVAGERVHHDLRQQAIVQQATRTPVTATLRADAPPAVGEHSGGAARVEASWVGPDGTVEAGEVAAPRGARAGDTVRAWIDERGAPVPEPTTEPTAVANGVTVGVLSWAVVAALCGLAFWWYRRALDRHRIDAWARAWDRFDRWSNRS